MPKVAIVGNCQAQALETMFLMYSNWEVVRVPPVFQLRLDQEDEICTGLDKVDVIFSQRVTDDFIIPYVRTSEIKNRFANVISWPNIYFAGYFPDVQYIYHEKIGKVVGPLEDYHLRLVHYYFTQGKTVEECALLYRTERLNDYYPDPIDASLAELATREEGMDLRMTPVLAKAVTERKIFYTVNHPSNWLLFELMQKMMQTQQQTLNTPSLHPYALSRINIPIYPEVRRRYNLVHLPEGSFVGIGRANTNSRVEDAPAKVYEDWNELILTFYRFYESLYATKGGPRCAQT